MGSSTLYAKIYRNGILWDESQINDNGCFWMRNECYGWMDGSSTNFPSKTWFFGIYLNFQWQKSLKNQYLPHSESKFYQINSTKSGSSRSFQQHQRHIPIPPKFSATI
jgi:hypothetical protein